MSPEVHGEDSEEEAVRGAQLLRPCPKRRRLDLTPVSPSALGPTGQK